MQWLRECLPGRDLIIAARGRSGICSSAMVMLSTSRACQLPMQALLTQGLMRLTKTETVRAIGNAVVPPVVVMYGGGSTVVVLCACV